jgi:uncharacterized protein YdeI (YjbR/CyaY-like superfamily)
METLAFKSSAEFRKWLAANHEKIDGLWLRMFKKASGQATVTYAEALDEALCHGWIDGQRKSFDEHSFIQKFTPRRARSKWSKLNTQHAERLIQAGKMGRAGLAAIEAAKDDGRWEAAYDSPRNAAPPEDFFKALGRNKKAKVFFETLNRVNVYAVFYRLQSARKPETRERRMKAILAMLGRGEKFH